MRSRIATFIILAGLFAFAWFGRGRIAHSQVNGDGKVIPGTYGQLISCNFTIGGNPVPQITTTVGNWLDLFTLSLNTMGSGSNCVVRWPLVRDHASTVPSSVVVHAFSRNTSANYGGISCRLGIVQHGTTPDDSQIDNFGSWVNIPTGQNGIPQSLPLPLPTLIQYPLTGHAPSFSGGAMSVDCDFGNDEIVTDVTYVESGAD